MHRERTVLTVTFLLLYASAIIVPTPDGNILGVSTPFGYNVFRGIPYSEKPQRWTHAIPKQPWSYLLNATRFGSECPQSNNLFTDKSEDCLFLNVWSPSKINETLPVMVYIHGGAWTGGQSQNPIYFGDFFANGSLPVVLVSLNYRLGSFGFLVLPSHIENNLGIKDQMLALQWVQKNIKSFGGDPDRVTIFGQSAGGASVSVHLTMNSSEKVFSKAIIQSDPMGFTFRSIDQSIPCTVLLASNLGCARVNQSEMLECMKGKSMEQVLKAQDSTIWIPWPIGIRKDMPWQPVIDNKLILDQPWNLLKAGKIKPGIKSVIMGTVQNESTTFVHSAMKDPLGWIVYEGLIYALFGVSDGLKALKLYPPMKNGADNRVILGDLVTDLIWNCPMREAAKGIQTIATTRLYHFLHAPTFDPQIDYPYCSGVAACHCSEIPYVFHSAEFEGSKFYTPQEHALSFMMLDYWKRFAHDKETTKWSPFELSKQSAFMFKTVDSEEENMYRSERCDFLDGKFHN